MSRWFANKAAVAILFGVATLALAETDPEKLMQAVDQQSAQRVISLKAVFEVHQANGVTARKHVQVLEFNGDGARRTLLRFLSPPALKGLTMLSIKPDHGPKQHWLYAPLTGRVRPLGDRENSELFAGTDFTYEDLQPAPADSFSYKLLSSSEKMNGHPAYKLERRPRDPSASQYAYAYIWVARDIPCILFEQLYDAQQHQVRTLAASQLKNVGGFWGARRIDMRTVSANTHTILTIDEANTKAKLTAEMFSPQAIAQQGEAVPE